MSASATRSSGASARLPAGRANGSEPAARYLGGELRLKRRLEQAHVVIGFEGLSYADP